MYDAVLKLGVAVVKTACGIRLDEPLGTRVLGAELLGEGSRVRRGFSEPFLF